MRSTLTAARRVVPGLTAVAILSGVATWVAAQDPFTALRIGPIVVGIAVGVLIGNAGGSVLPQGLAPGITFSAKKVLRAAIVLYGFRITFAQIAEVGIGGLLLDCIMVTGTLILGTTVGTRWLGLDRATALLTSAGAAICGAAAIVATEPIVKAEPHKTAVAVGTVVIFGTAAMFLYPLVFRAGWIPLSEEVFGVYAGATIHGVAHVVGASEAVGPAAAGPAVIVKMTRVMLLAPALLLIGWLFNRGTKSAQSDALVIPWFAVGFVAVAGFNSLGLLSQSVVDTIVRVDGFLLTMAMTALGLNTVASKFRGIGWQPLKLAFVLATWLIVGGFVATTVLVGTGL